MNNITDLALFLHKEKHIKQCRMHYDKLLETVEFELRSEYPDNCTYAELISAVDGLDNLVQKTLDWTDIQFYIFKLSLIRVLEEKQLSQYIAK